MEADRYESLLRDDRIERLAKALVSVAPEGLCAGCLTEASDVVMGELQELIEGGIFEVQEDTCADCYADDLTVVLTGSRAKGA